MLNFFNKLKKDKWYKIEDGFEILAKDNGILDIKFGITNCSINIPNLIAMEYYKTLLTPVIEKLKLSSDIPEFNGSYSWLTEEDAKGLSIDELNFVLSEMEGAENYEGCEMIKKIINEKRKDNKES